MISAFVTILLCIVLLPVVFAATGILFGLLSFALKAAFGIVGIGLKLALAPVILVLLILAICIFIL